MSEAIKKSVREYILTTFLPGEDPAELTDDLPLISGGVLDSIATLKLIMHLEETFGIGLEAHEADKEHLDTVNRIADLVVAKQKRG
jgi:acyl carrier protein